MVRNWSEVLPKKVKEKTGRKHPITCTAHDLGLRCLPHQSLGLEVSERPSHSVSNRDDNINCLFIGLLLTPASSFGSTNVTNTMILILNGVIKNKISMARRPAYWSSKVACEVSIYLKFDVSHQSLLTAIIFLFKLKTKGTTKKVRFPLNLKTIGPTIIYVRVNDRQQIPVNLISKFSYRQI